MALLLALMLSPRLAVAQTTMPASEALKSSDANVRAQAVRQLAQSGDATTVATLASMIHDPSEKVRREVVLSLASIRAVAVLDPLISATKDEDPKIRVLAVESLAGYYSGEMPSTGFSAFWQRAWRKAKSRFVEDNVRIDPGIEAEPKVVAALVAVLNDTSALEPSRKAADALGILVAKSAVPALIKAAYSSDPDLAVEALNALAKIHDFSAGPQLINLLDSESKDVKRQAAVTLGVLRAKSAIAKLQSIHQNDPDRKTRAKALEGLSFLGSPVSTPLFIKALWSSEKDLRVLGAEGLARAREASTLGDLERAIQVEKDAEVRLAIEFAITALGRADYLSVVVKELGSRMRGNAAQAYLTELAQDPSFLPRLYPYASSQDTDVRRRLCTVLMYTGNESSVTCLERLAQDSDTDVATEALRALRAVRQRKA
ncbi:MAG: HEAT repeat domain-containing protein [Terriglobia bacterium]